MCVLSPTPSVILPAVAAAVMWIVAGILQHNAFTDFFVASAKPCTENNSFEITVTSELGASLHVLQEMEGS